MTALRTDLPAAPELRDGTDLLLRRHRLADLDAIYEQCQDELTQRFTTIPVPYTRADAREFLDHLAESWTAGTMAGFAIEVDGRFAGTVDLRLQEGDWAEIGFGLAPWARHRGIMTRSARLALAWGFRELGLTGVHWLAQVGNGASRRVAVACGFTIEGTVRGLLVYRGRRVDGWVGTVLPDELR